MNPLSQLSSYQWMDIIQYLSAEEFKALRLAGNKSMCVMDPELTSHLQLRMDRAPFFRRDAKCSENETRQWLMYRSKLVINDANATICPNRVASLAANGYLNSVTQVVVSDSHRHRTLISILSTLPNVRSLKLLDQGDQLEAQDELESIITHVGRMSSLTTLDIEFDCVIDGSRLSFLGGLGKLQHLRLRGFDLSGGIHNLAALTNLEYLHLCHGNFFSSPDDDINEKDLLSLGNLTKVKSLHLEGFDGLTGVGFEPFLASDSLKHLVLKHCQEMSEECVSYIERMRSLESLHVILCAYDDAPAFEREHLERLSNLTALKSLSLFYCVSAPNELISSNGFHSLETLNVAFDDEVDEGDLDSICQPFSPASSSLKKIRVFSEEGMSYSTRRWNVEIEFDRFNFGDLVYLD